jgi:single-strand DNA-binding protein
MTQVNFNSKSMIIITGKIAKDPEMRYAPSGQAVTAVSIPVERRWKTEDEQEHKETTWFKVTTWQKPAEIVNKWCKKGTILQVVGILAVDPLTGASRIYAKQDGTAATSLEIKPSEITILGGARSKDEVNDGTSAPATIQQNGELPPEDEFPF